MRLLAAAHVRNEADIVEAFVRHNLAVLDGIAIVDHMSVDETPDILHELKAEGLPVFIARRRESDDPFPRESRCATTKAKRPRRCRWCCARSKGCCARTVRRVEAAGA